jgi:tetrathionate reductase subunit B
VVTCPTRTRIFGDLNDPKSEVSRLLKEGGLVRVINPKVDTKPNIYFLEGTMPLTWPKVPTLPGNVHMPLVFWRTYRT